jgi:hypothetical protein
MSSISISPTSATMTHGNATPVILAALDATGPCIWELTGQLPPGSTFQGDSGSTGCRITGAPTAVGVFTPTVSCLDQGQTPNAFATQQLTITVD